jgi:histidinol-phosphate phosphatase family protein
MKPWRRPVPRATVATVPRRKRALFLDFGGTLTVLRDNRTLVDADGHPVLQPNVGETLARVCPAFDACFIASNQGRIGRGEISEAEVRRRFAWVNERLGRPFTDWRFCPHLDADGCPCRKPRPGLFLDLAVVHGIDLQLSTHVGDSEKDRTAAAAAGIPTFIWAPEFFGW